MKGAKMRTLDDEDLAVELHNKAERAKAAGKPMLREKKLARSKRDGADHERAACSSCGAMRPRFCVVETKKGWLGDCCVSDARRHGRGAEVEGLVSIINPSPTAKK